MRYFKKLEFEWDVVSIELQRYFKKYIQDTDANGWVQLNMLDVIKECPSIKSIESDMNSTIDYIAFVVYHHREQGDIHIDSDRKNITRILLPVLNCQYSETRFYRTLEVPSLAHTSHGVPYMVIDPYKCVLVDSVSLDDGPILFRVKEPHGVFISEGAEFPRVSCTISLSDDMSSILDD